MPLVLVKLNVGVCVSVCSWYFEPTTKSPPFCTLRYRTYFLEFKVCILIRISTSTCNMCEYVYEYECLIITSPHRPLISVLTHPWEFADYRTRQDKTSESMSEYWLMYKSTSTGLWYILYRQQYCICQSLKRESFDFYRSETLFQLSIVHVNYLCQYICLNILCNLVQWHFNVRSIAIYWLSRLTITTCCQFKIRAKIGRYHELCAK